MRDLRLVAVTEDGGTLLLAADDGEEFSLMADGRVRAALRNDRERLGQLAVPLEGTLRPREIQARIRAGESAEEIAASSGMPVDHVARFEGPVLGERAHVAAQARTALVKHADVPAGSLGDLVTARLKSSGVNPDTLVWDSWRREDGTWDVELTYLNAGGPGRAQWLFDPQRRVVTAMDDDARWLTDPNATRPSATVRSVPPLGETAGSLSSAEPEAPGPRAESLAPEPSPEPRAVEPAAGEPDQPAAGSLQPRRPPSAVPSRGPRRAAVPSWDDIVFGTRKDDDPPV